MSSESIVALVLTAFFLGSVHTALGPDHYLPFAALARAGRWTLQKTLLVTILCGLGHVLSSVLIGLVGVAAGLAVAAVTPIEEARAPIATWALIGFGLTYGTWGFWRGFRGRKHSHSHAHADGSAHAHEHGHAGDHVHPHPGARRSTGAIWALFIVFVLGPCEPLIPLLMFPAATHSWGTLVLVTTVFAATTLLTMTVIVAALWFGLGAVRLGSLERYAHAFAGSALALSGVAVLALGI